MLQFVRLLFWHVLCIGSSSRFTSTSSCSTLWRLLHRNTAAAIAASIVQESCRSRILLLLLLLLRIVLSHCKRLHLP